MFSRYFCLCLFLTAVLSLVLCYGDTNVVTNGGFESGMDGWSERGCSISAVTEPVHGGSGGAKVYDRTEAWQGIKQSMLGKMQDGQTYQVSAWVKLESADSDTVIVSVERADDVGTKYINVGKAVATSSDWAQISGEFTLDVEGTLTTLDVYFEGPAAGVSFFVDDVNVSAPIVPAPVEPNEPEEPDEPNQPDKPEHPDHPM